jgi:hypothetical protein
MVEAGAEGGGARGAVGVAVAATMGINFCVL